MKVQYVYRLCHMYQIISFIKLFYGLSIITSCDEDDHSASLKMYKAIVRQIDKAGVGGVTPQLSMELLCACILVERCWSTQRVAPSHRVPVSRRSYLVYLALLFQHPPHIQLHTRTYSSGTSSIIIIMDTYIYVTLNQTSIVKVIICIRVKAILSCSFGDDLLSYRI